MTDTHATADHSGPSTTYTKTKPTLYQLLVSVAETCPLLPHPLPKSLWGKQCGSERWGNGLQLRVSETRPHSRNIMTVTVHTFLEKARRWSKLRKIDNDSALRMKYSITN